MYFPVFSLEQHNADEFSKSLIAIHFPWSAPLIPVCYAGLPISMCVVHCLFTKLLEWLGIFLSQVWMIHLGSIP